MSEYSGIAVYCETDEKGLKEISLEALGIGRDLADKTGTGLSAVIFGSNTAAFAPLAIAGGADKVYTVDDERINSYQPDYYLASFAAVMEQLPSAVVIMGQSDTGRDFAPKLAYRLGAAATMDCTGLAIDAETGRLLASKPVYGGNAVGVYRSSSGSHVVTVRSKAMSVWEGDDSRSGEILTVAVDLDPVQQRSKTVESVVAEQEGIRLEDASIVVTGGRGIGAADGFAAIQELAGLLHGAVGASRPPCDNGWVSDTMQVGLTGKIVAPELYIAVAVSGASQHLSGCSGARTIVAINKDKEANIFRHARYGVVGDWKKVLPAFTAKLKELGVS